MMKNILIIFLMLSGMLAGNLVAQPNANIAKEKMKLIAHWTGRWQGESEIRMGSGDPKKSMVDEHVLFKLDSTILMVEGVGKVTNTDTQKDSVVHHALGILSYDQTGDEYKFKTYINDGRTTEAWFTIANDKNFQWGFDTPKGKLRYTILLDPSKQTWHETGEFSRDGKAWMKFFEMNLTKVE